MAEVAKLSVRIGADLSDLSTGLKEAQNKLTSVGKSLSGIGKGLTKFVTLPIAGAGTAMLKAGMDFEEGMSNIKALGGATGEELNNLKDLALDMGAKTKFSAVEAAKGIEELIKSGVNTEQILNGGLKGALSLAAAGELELGEAAEVASTALNAFKSDNLTVSRAADILAGAANASATDVRELNYALSMVSSVASGVGLSFEDTSTALAVFAQNGLKGSDAGTSLKSMLMNLQPATDKQAALFKKLNLLNEKGESIFFNSAGKLKGMSEIAAILNSRLKGLTDAQRLAAMETIFGSDAIRAANILYKEGSDGLVNMKTEMSKVTAEEVAKEKMDNLKGSIENLKGSLETLAVQLYESNAGPLKAFVDGLTGIVNGFMGLNTNVQQGILMLAGFVASIGPLALILGGISKALGFLAPVVSAIAKFLGKVSFAFAAVAGGAATVGEALVLIMPVWGWIVAAVLAVGAALVWLWNNCDWFKNAVATVWNAIKDAALALFEWLSPYIMAAFDFLKAYWLEWAPIIMTIFSNSWELIKAIFGAAVDWITPYVMQAFNTISAFWDKWGVYITAAFKATLGIIGTVFKTTFGIIADVVTTVLKTISGVIKIALDLINGNWASAWNTFMQVITDVWNGIMKVVDKIVNGIINAVNKVIKAINSIPSVNIPTIPNVGAPAAASIKAHADGGVFTKPTLWGNHLIAEKGDEALMPLDKLEGMAGKQPNIIQIILDGRVIQEYTDNGLGSRLTALGGA